ncbi:Uncharacterized protein TCM_002948 [Theobroma cacao]|uniref:Uncharacterized protein n=1 Tax=Theobroma cacao TaxID=3641 RepID=A0A061DMK1_THECC|nr:Uncharacterized protein TCM_002948 [Theobroma cacao]
MVLCFARGMNSRRQFDLRLNGSRYPVTICVCMQRWCTGRDLILYSLLQHARDLCSVSYFSAEHDLFLYLLATLHDLTMSKGRPLVDLMCIRCEIAWERLR